MDAKAIINLMGGATLLSEMLGKSRSAVGMWRLHGIPAKYWIDIVEKAREKKICGITLKVLRAHDAPRRRV
jgi:hypothetical protein